MCKIYTVIHHLSSEQTLSQAEVAKNAGIDGVFLISHTGNDKPLGPLAREIKEEYPELKVGLNYLRLGAIAAVSATGLYNLDMAWGDYCGVSSKGLDTQGVALSNLIKDTKIELFASVAFKYQPEEPNPNLAAINAIAAGFIPTTSGDATGHAPSINKIKGMSEASNGLLAVASGMTPENVVQYCPYLSYILVSTGISKDFHTFDKELLNKFVTEVKSK